MQSSKADISVEKYDNTKSTLGKGQRYTMVQHPLRTKVSTMSKNSSHMGAAKSSAVKPLATMEELKNIQKQRAEEQRANNKAMQMARKHSVQQPKQ